MGPLGFGRGPEAAIDASWRAKTRGTRALGRSRADDDAARWLDEHDPKPKPQPPKSATKSKVLHQWRQRQQRS